MMENCNENLMDMSVGESIELQQINMANTMAEMAQIGFVSDANSIRKLSITSMLFNAYENLPLFSDVQKNNLKNAYDYAIQL